MWSTTELRRRAEAERWLGRYLTAAEVELIRQGRASEHGGLSLEEIRAVKRIWPGMQLEFKLEARALNGV